MIATALNSASMSNQLVPPQQVTEQFSALFNYLNRLEEFEDTVIELLPFGTDDEVTQARSYAVAMGSTGWRIVCACDAVALSRAALKGGRGKTDDAGVGRLSTAKDEANKAGKKPWTVRRNAQIFNTFKTILRNQHSLLDEKGYFEAALRAPDSRKAIKIFEKEKSENPSFTPEDAHRLAKKLKENHPKAGIPNKTDYLDPSFKTFLVDLEDSQTAA